MRQIKIPLVCLCLMWHCGGAFAQSGDSTSTVAQKFRLSFDQELLNRLRAHDDFRYAEPPENRPNILKVIFQKVFEWLLVLVGNEFFAWLILTLIILVGVVGLGFGLYGIFGLGKTVPIYGTEPDQLKYGIKSENIHEISFVDEIETAVDERNFKKAIRLSYLFALKMLANKDIIDWKVYKTNHDYAYEIQDEQYRMPFSQLSYLFEYVWYGDFEAGNQHYTTMRHALDELKDKLRQDA